MPRPLIYDNGGTGRVYGMELVARHDFTNNFTGWLAYTLSRAERRDSGETEDRLFDFDQTHILTVVGSYLLPRNWQVGGRFRLVSGNPITPVDRLGLQRQRRPLRPDLRRGQHRPRRRRSTSSTCGSTSAGSTSAGC